MQKRSYLPKTSIFNKTLGCFDRTFVPNHDSNTDTPVFPQLVCILACSKENKIFSTRNHIHVIQKRSYLLKTIILPLNEVVLTLFLFYITIPMQKRVFFIKLCVFYSDLSKTTFSKKNLIHA